MSYLAAQRMGQNSSQLTGPQTATADQAHSTEHGTNELTSESHREADDVLIPEVQESGEDGRKKSRKGRKRKARQQTNDEEESALALLKLRNNVQFADPVPFHEDGLAASAQLIAESSPTQVSKESRVADPNKRESKTRNHGSRTEHTSGRQEEKDTLYPELEHDLPSDSPIQARLPYLAQSSLHLVEHPQSTLSLDDINSEDEAIAPILRAYERGAASPDVDTEHFNTGDSNFAQQLSNTYTTSYQEGLPTSAPGMRSPEYTGRQQNAEFSDQSLFINDNDIGNHEASTDASDGRYMSTPNYDRTLIDPRLSGTCVSTLDDHVTHENRPIDEDTIDDGQIPNTERRGNKTRRRRRRLQTTSSAPPSGKKLRSSHIPKDYNPSLEDLAANGGQFTQEEKTKLFAFRDAYCQQHDLDHKTFNEHAQSNARNNPTLNRFWTEICEVIPYRKRQTVQKFCRRHFHNYSKRGIWTADEDDTIKLFVADKGNQWKFIGDVMNRYSEDVRDRYRNYLHNSEFRRVEAWQKSEVDLLIQSVAECIRDNYQNQGLTEGVTDEELEKLIHWSTVSDKMAGERGRLQCSYKWKQLKLNDQAILKRQIIEAKRELARLERGNTDDWRTKQARRKVGQFMEVGDRHDLLSTLSSWRAGDESEIMWSKLARSQVFGGRWKPLELKVAWEMTKEEVEMGGVLGEGFREVVNMCLEKLVTNYGDRVNERYVPDEASGIASQAGSKKRQRTSEGGGEKRARTVKSMKSKEYVSQSDEEEEQDEEEDEEEEAASDGATEGGAGGEEQEEAVMVETPAEEEEENEDARIARRVQLLQQY